MLIAHSVEAVGHLGPATIHVLRSKWHADHVDKLVSRFIGILKDAGCTGIPVHTLSGCLEMPLAAQDIFDVEKGRLEAIVCFGVLLKGETSHDEMVLSTTTNAFALFTMSARVPLINAILPVNDMKHVVERSRDDEFNKGIEAALATVETIRWRREIRKKVTG